MLEDRPKFLRTRAALDFQLQDHHLGERVLHHTPPPEQPVDFAPHILPAFQKVEVAQNEKREQEKHADADRQRIPGLQMMLSPARLSTRQTP